MPKKVDISPEVRDVLERARCEGNTLTLPPGQLDPKFYREVDKVLVALGGKWQRGQRLHVFPSPAAPLIAAALESGQAVDQKRTAEQFFTPMWLARKMADALGLPARDIRHILEPSAGGGNLVQAALEHGVEFLTIVEKDPALVTKLADMLPHGSGGVWAADFMEWSPSARAPIDAVMMNPPFSRNQDIAHVQRAFGFLRLGGKLAAIMSPHFTYAEDKPSKGFRELIGYPDFDLGGLSSVAEAAVEMLPAGTFKEAGTNIASVLVTITKGD